MLFQYSKLICPYCFQKIRPKSILFRCLNIECKFENDPVLAKYTGLNEEVRNIVLRPSAKGKFYRGGIPWKTICPECNTETTQAICPLCHNILPPGFGREKAFNIALVGGVAVGKSNYIGVMINELDRRVLPNLGCALRKKTEDTIRRYFEDFYKPLFEDNLVANPVKKTSLQDKDVRNPMFFRIDFPKKRRYLIKTITPGVDINFFDAAGEVLRSVDTTTILARYIGYADALILVIDPLQCKTIRSKLLANGISKSLLPPEEDQYQLFQTIIGFYKQINGIDLSTPLKIPVAVAFSKIDALRSILPTNTAILNTNNHRTGIDLEDIERVDEEIRSYMLSESDWNLKNILTTCNNSLNKFKFFAFSALGDMPNEQNQLSRGVLGIRVVDPIMWLLSEIGMLSDKM